jgi:hypothetical protein
MATWIFAGVALLFRGTIKLVRKMDVSAMRSVFVTGFISWNIAGCECGIYDQSIHYDANATFIAQAGELFYWKL